MSREAATGDRSRTRRDLVEAQLLEQAAALFAEKGFGATSLQDVAERVGMSRPALYHYVSSKDDLLTRIVADFAEGGEQAVTQVAERTDLDPPATLHEMVRALCLEVASGTSRFRLVLNSEANLPAELAKRIRRSKRVVTQTVTSVLAAGVDSGDFRTVDPQLAALGILGTCNWIAWWYEPGSSRTPEEIADGFASQIVHGVVTPDTDGRHRGNPLAVLATMRSKIDTLEHLLSTGK